MRITFCHNETEYLCDAQSIFLQRLMPILKKFGHEPRLLLIAPRNPEVCALTIFCRQQEIPIDSTYSRGSMGNNIRWCLRKLKENPPDVFVPHHCYWALYASKYLKKSGIPSIGVLHSDDEATRRLITLFSHPSSPYLLDGFVAVSQVIADQIQEFNPALPVTVIPCGVPIPGSLINEPNGILRIAYFGRIVQEQKRIVELSAAFARIAHHTKFIECHIWGNGADEDRVRETLRKYPSGHKVVLHDAIPSFEVYPRLQEHHVIVLLSDYEGTPTSVMEGMANGLVPVVTNIGGGTEALVEHQVTGLVVQDREDEFIRTILSLRQNIALWKTLSRNAAARIREYYSAEKTALKWVEYASKLFTSKKCYGDICIPSNVVIPEIWRIAGPNYFSKYVDCIAGLYAHVRYFSNKVFNSF